jgi:hypothetical protein
MGSSCLKPSPCPPPPTPRLFQVYFFSVTNNGNNIEFNRRRPVVDFKRDVSTFLRRGRPNIASCGLWRPHGIVFRAPPPPAPPAPPTTPVGR